MHDHDAQASDFLRREQELRAKEQEIRLKELELEIQRYASTTDLPMDAGEDVPFHKTRKHQEKPGFWKRFSRKATLTVQFVALVVLAVVAVRLANFLVGVAMVLAIVAIAYFFLFSNNSDDP